jgi:protein tyrosine phosphatase (PTP) superfamily phosphohydrolase (DUF442 family)
MPTDRPPTTQLRHLLPLSAILLLAGACGSGPEPAGDPSRTLSVDAEVDAYELAGSIPLPQTPPEELPGLHNVYHLSGAVISGSEPHGEEAFEALAAMGVRTILSVDGKVPDRELAARHGMRYVHAPIRYDGIEDEELIQIAKTFRELEGPFYVHCFHGKHRGPAAAAVGRIVIDGADRVRAVSEMRQWCGTSKKYRGLYETLAAHELPSAETTSAYEWDFPAAKPVAGLRGAMVDMARHFDDLELAVLADFGPDPEHPDLAPLNDARVLLRLFEGCLDLEEVDARPADFRADLERSRAAGADLVELLEGRIGEALSPDDLRRAGAAFESIDQACASCHKGYRNG